MIRWYHIKTDTSDMPKNTKKVIKVAELFAGVGGFHIGLAGAKDKKHSYEIEWSNQWEPGTKKQHASEIYKLRFDATKHSNEDISKVAVKDIPNHDLLVGGFPCQDYSVARTLSQAAGLGGKKGVLWWEIHRILKEKGSKAPSMLMLENVDRLIKSPASQRGRDFAVMLASLSDLGYAVEWRVINAAEYGMPQRRRRIYILGYKEGSPIYKELIKEKENVWLEKTGVAAKAFPVEPVATKAFEIKGDLAQISSDFNKGLTTSPFQTGGLMLKRKVTTFKAEPFYKGPFKVLNDIIFQNDSEVDESYFVAEKTLKEWRRLKGAKKEKRKTKSGFIYEYSEGPMIFPDMLDRPSRTIVTGEGGSTPSRFKHLIKTKTGK
jgi:DNA (cytosine-5)-methyltransferase 1